MMIGIGIPSSQSRIKPIVNLLSASGRGVISPGADHASPSAVAQLAALDRRERSAESADQHRRREPERELRGRAARFIGRRSCLIGHVGDALLGFLLREAGVRRDHLRQIAAVVRRDFAALAQAAAKDAKGLGVPH
jgi:hypothetical protein